MSKTIFNIIQSNAAFGGMENIFLDYSNILQKNKFNLIAITSKNFVHLEELKKSGIQTEILNSKGHFDLFAALKLYFLIKKYSPNLIIAHNGRSFATINLCRKIFGFKNIKLMAVSHGGSAKRILKFDYIITVAKHIEEKIRTQNFSGIIKTIYNGIKIVPYQKNKNTDGSFNFGILSRLSKEKNVEIAIEAFEKFMNKKNNTKLIIAGDGPELNNLKQLSQNPEITFIGHITDRKKFFDQIDIFLQPSSNEPFGLTILEAFNYQTPVIAADTHGPKEIIKNNSTGYLFEAGSADSLLHLMKKSYDDQDPLKTVTSNAYEDLVTNFSYEKMAQNLFSFIEKI